MPYPFAPGEVLTSGNLNAALDMRVRTDGTNLVLTPGAVLFGSSSGGFGADATNLFFDNANNRLGVVNNTPQAMLSVGKAAGTLRVYNSYTDASNGEWGQYSWASNILRIGSEANGTGLAREVRLTHGGTDRVWITDVGVGIGVAPGNRILYVGGTGTSASPINFTTTVNSAITNLQYGLLVNATFLPSGPSLATIQGLDVNPIVSGSATIPITTLRGADISLQTDAGYAQQVTNAYGVQINVVQNGTLPFTNYYSFRSTNTSNGNGITSGTINNIAYQDAGATAGAAAGGTINNTNFYGNLPSGSGAGTTNNYGLRITGNGGSGGGGTTNNWAIYSESTANSLFTGRLGLNGTTPAVPLDLRGTFASSETMIATIQTTLQSSGAGTQYGLHVNPTVAPTGASLATFGAAYLGGKLSGSVFISNSHALLIDSLDLTSYTGANISQANGVYINPPVGGSATKWATTWHGLQINASTNGQGSLTGTIYNQSLVVVGASAGAGVGGTINNRTALLYVPNGTGVGTNTNIGLYITGNGGASATNLAIYSDSTANSQINNLRIGAGTANPTNATGPFLYITAAAGVPTGVPIYSAAGSVAIQWDSTNKKLMVYDHLTSSWKGVVLA